jgi:hypothetical protein
MFKLHLVGLIVMLALIVLYGIQKLPDSLADPWRYEHIAFQIDNEPKNYNTDFFAGLISGVFVGGMLLLIFLAQYRK